MYLHYNRTTTQRVLVFIVGIVIAPPRSSVRIGINVKADLRAALSELPTPNKDCIFG